MHQGESVPKPYKLKNQSAKPIPFIMIKDTQLPDGSPDVKFKIHKEAIDILSKYTERKVAVLTIAGPQRTGKSFLANRFVDQMKGFAIGPSTQPCTKGNTYTFWI